MTDVEAEYRLRRTGHHEAGHAAVAVRLGGEIVGPVSIEPHLAWSGIAYVLPRQPSEEALARIDSGAPLCMWEPELRFYFEARILILLAGVHGARCRLNRHTRPAGPSSD